VVKISKDRAVLGAEHPYCDSLQLVMVTLFFVVWGLDSFVFSCSTFLAGLVPLALRLFLAVPSSGFGAYLSAKSHPMYLGTLMFCLGFFLATLSLLSLGVWIVFFFFYDEMATYEEKDLTRILGEEYTAYQKRVPKWIPRLRSRS
jgi:hypothetical protein